MKRKIIQTQFIPWHKHGDKWNAPILQALCSDGTLWETFLSGNGDEWIPWYQITLPAIPDANKFTTPNDH